MRTPEAEELAAPEFPPELRWIGAPFVRMDRLLGTHVKLVEFWDFGRINSHRTLPYMKAWHERYSDSGLQVIGVHSPGFSFTRDPELVVQAIDRLGVPYPVALDPDFEVWRAYGNRGWPARYVFDRRGKLTWMHYGEGEYRATELEIQRLLLEIDDELALPPEPVALLRPEDAPGALMKPQTADITLPVDRGRLTLDGDWAEGEDYLEAAAAGASAHAEWDGGECYAILSGVPDPGPAPCEGTFTAEREGVCLHGFQFTPGPPAKAASG